MIQLDTYEQMIYLMEKFVIQLMAMMCRLDLELQVAARWLLKIGRMLYSPVLHI